MLKDALWLMRRICFSTRFGIIFTTLFYLVYGAVAGLMTNAVRDPENDWLELFIIDIVMATFMSSVGFVFIKDYFQPYWQKDTFTRSLATLRVLPIPVETLALSRLIQILVFSPVTTFMFFFGFYVLSGWAKEIPFGLFLAFILCWFAYGNACSGLLVLAEWGASGKRYMVFSFLIILLMLVVIAVIYVWTGYTVSGALVFLLQQPFGWLWPVLALAAAAGVHIWSQRRLRAILSSRDFA